MIRDIVLIRIEEGSKWIEFERLKEENEEEGWKVDEEFGRLVGGDAFVLFYFLGCY